MNQRASSDTVLNRRLNIECSHRHMSTKFNKTNSSAEQGPFKFEVPQQEKQMACGIILEVMGAKKTVRVYYITLNMLIVQSDNISAFASLGT